MLKIWSLSLCLVLAYVGESISKRVSINSEVLHEERIGNKKTYYFNHEKKFNWENAEKFCKGLRLQLVAIDSYEKSRDLMGFLHYYGVTDVALWSSGNNLNDPLGSTWRWGTNGPKATYLNWAPGEPKDAQPERDPVSERNCLRTESKTMKWRDDDCSKEFHVACRTSYGYFLDLFNNVTWSYAYEFCPKYKNGDLITLETAEDVDRFYSSIYMPDGKSVSFEYWIGGYKLKDGWYWGNNSVPFSYTNWAEGAPSSGSGAPSSGEAAVKNRCIRLREATLEWEAADCNEELDLICEDP